MDKSLSNTARALLRGEINEVSNEWDLMDCSICTSV